MNPKILAKLLIVATLILSAGLWFGDQLGAVVAQEPEAEDSIHSTSNYLNALNAISYQGQLRRGQAPVNETCDLQFTMFDQDIGGTQLGAVEQVNNVTITDGVFDVALNDKAEFGSNAFTGGPRWLETAVRCPAGSSNFTPLSPRRGLTAVPYSKSLQPGAVISGTVLSRGAVEATNIGAGGDGVVGNANDANGSGVVGLHRAPAGVAPGVEGTTLSKAPSAVGVLGEVDSDSPGEFSAGLRGINNGTGGNGIGVWGSQDGSGSGVYGTSVSGNGIVGEVTSTTPNGYSAGVRGINNGTGANGIGVWGSQDGQGWGIYGTSLNGIAVHGEALGDSQINYGIYGYTASPSGFAGYFQGPVHVAGTLTKSAGSFKIDHPLDPAHKYLSHSFVESPEMLNIYNGTVILDTKGEAVVELPDWFEALNRDFRYQLTPIGGPGPNLYIATKIKDHRFTIAGGQPGLEVSWQVTGVRHDPYAEAHPIPVEEDKPAEAQGTYLNPELYGQPETLGLNDEQGPELVGER
jgi:hypothetical protein